MKLVEQHQIKSSHKFFKECDSLCFDSKNLYNYANYIIRQEFINNANYINKFEMQKKLQGAAPDYLKLPAKVSQQTLRLLDKNWVSFFKSIKDWTKNPGKYLGKPKLPRYKNKLSGRFPTIYDKQAVGKSELVKNSVAKLSKTNIKIKTKILHTDLKQVRIIPRYDFYVIEIVYNKEIVDKKLNADNVIGIDLGVNNTCAIVSANKDINLLVNGRPLKAMNSYYNKKKAKLQSKLMKGEDDLNLKQKTSRAIRKLSNKRNNKINNYLHRISKKIITLCLTKDVGRIIIGKNKNWKQEVNIGRKNNQNFVAIPLARLINMITYKAELCGIIVKTTEESYTSKCSALDNESLCHHTKYLGRRIKRGLFKTRDKYILNADTNGALNIIRKVISNFSIRENEIQGFAVSPRFLTI